MEERFVDLEMRISHQEDMIDELNKAIYHQQNRIDQLETTILELAQHLSERVDSNMVLRHEKPPHY